jgi:hypothetical protein
MDPDFLKKIREAIKQKEKDEADKKERVLTQTYLQREQSSRPEDEDGKVWLTSKYDRSSSRDSSLVMGSQRTLSGSNTSVHVLKQTTGLISSAKPESTQPIHSKALPAMKAITMEKTQVGPKIGKEVWAEGMRRERMGINSARSLSSRDTFESDKVCVDEVGNIVRGSANVVRTSDRTQGQSRGLGGNKKSQRNSREDPMQTEIHKKKFEAEYRTLKRTGNLTPGENILLREVVNSIISELNVCEKFINCKVLAIDKVFGLDVVKLEVLSVDKNYPLKNNIKVKDCFMGLFRAGADTEYLYKNWSRVRLNLVNPEIATCNNSGRVYLLIKYFRYFQF